MIKVAVVGTGSIGSRHLALLKELPGVEAMALPKRGDRTLQDTFREGATHCIVATDTRCHVQDSLQALELGMNLLVEKPVSYDVASALPLTRAAQKRSKGIFVGCVFRCCESLNLFRERLGETGALHSVQVTCQSYLPDWRPNRDYRQSYSARRNEGGVLLDLIHEIDYAAWIFGWPNSLQARLKNWHRLGIESEEMAGLWWETENGTQVSVCLDYVSRVPTRKIVAQGENGMLEWDGLRGVVTFSVPGKKPEEMKSTQTKDQMYREQLLSFISQGTVSQGRYPLATLMEGLKALAICDAARLASESKKETPIVYPD